MIRLLAGLLAICLSLSCSLLLRAQTTVVGPMLELGKPVDATLVAGQTSSFRIAIARGQYMRLEIDEHGVDFVARLFAPDGQRIAESDVAPGEDTAPPISLIATMDGVYHLDLALQSAQALTRKVRVSVEELRMATPLDTKRLEAERLFAAAEATRAEGLKESFVLAQEKYEVALPLFRDAGDHSMEGFTLYRLGEMSDKLGEQQKAVEYLERAAAVYHALQTKESQGGEGSSLNYLGIISYHSGEFEKALEYYQRSLSIPAIDANPLQTPTTLSNIALIYARQGEPQKALNTLQQVLQMYRQLADRHREGVALTNIGKQYLSMGELQKALEYLLQALPIHRIEGNHYFEAGTLQSLCDVYAALGDSDDSLAYGQQALSVWRAVGDRAGQAATLDEMGLVYADQGAPQKALDNYNRALSLEREAGARPAEALTLDHIGRAHLLMNKPQEALTYYSQALQLERVMGGPGPEGRVLAETGAAYLASSDLQKATESLSQALPLLRASKDPVGEAKALGDMARIELIRGDLENARTDAESALRLSESVRQSVGAESLRASYFATVRGQYDLLIGILMQLDRQRPKHGYDAIAFETSERARARSLVEMLREANADIRQGVDPDLLDRERSLRELLDAKSARQVELFTQKHSQQQASQLENEIQGLNADYEQVEAHIRTRSPRYAELTQPRLLTLTDVQKEILDSDTLLLEYALGEDRSFLFAVTSGSIKSYELPSRTEIEALARQAYENLSVSSAAGARQTAAAVKELSRMLLQSVAGDLEKRRLVIVTEGGLQYIPFASLLAPSRAPTPLIVNHEIANLPSASTLAVMRSEEAGRQRAHKLVAVLADPVFERNDPRVGSRDHPTATLPSPENLERSAKEIGLLSFDRLRATRQEAEAIIAVAGKSETLEALDFDASRTMATSPELGQYQIVHIATHGLLNSRHPALSGLVLSLVDREGNPENGFLEAQEIYNLRLGADLVVLSACQTALGKEIRGEGLMGLTRGFMYAGAPRVVASLWKVPDQATTELMRRFYQGMLAERLRPAAALRAAQVSMWKEKRWARPYYWAGFTLQGEWK